MGSRSMSATMSRSTAMLLAVAVLFLVAAASAKSLPGNEESDIDEFDASVRHRAERSANGNTRNTNVRTTSNTASGLGSGYYNAVKNTASAFSTNYYNIVKGAANAIT